MQTRRALTLRLASLSVAVVALQAAVPGTLTAQAVRLGAPAAVFPEDFGMIQSVRELPDGRVLVADPLGQALYGVDMDGGARTVVGRQGQGPQEYLQPDAVWPLPGDSTLLVDLGNGRLVAIGPDLAFGPTMPIAVGEPQPGATIVLALPQGVDDRGNIYARALGGLGGPLQDSAAVLRIDRGTKAADTVATFKLEDRTQSTAGGAGARNVRIQSVPLSAQDSWGVAPDGSVVIARSAGYRVEWIAPDGTVRRGSPTPYERIAIGTPEKEEYLVEQSRSGGGIGISMQVSNGAMSMSFSRGRQGAEREIDSYEWPQEKPPFYPGRVLVDRPGRAWVRRHVDAGDPVTYDVFDRRGERTGTVVLEGARRIVGFGAGTVYVVSYDDLDLSWLERYDLPPL